MLTVTPTAAEAVNALVAGTEIDDQTGGLRISSTEAVTEPSALRLELALVNQPEPTDNEIAAGGAHVFLESTVAEILDDQVLDAAVESGRVQFRLFERGASEPSQDGGPAA
jgi:Fe-S cluster assembly iron-binding protein IscA